MTRPSIHDPAPSSVWAWSTQFDEQEMAHVLPDFGPRHAISTRCWCHPVRDDERYVAPAIVHNVAQ